MLDLGFLVDDILLLRANWAGDHIVVTPDVATVGFLDLWRSHSSENVPVNLALVPTCYLAKDLRENEKYEVKEFHPDIVRGLENGAQMIQQVEEAITKLTPLYQAWHEVWLKEETPTLYSTGPFLHYDPHIEPTFQEAVQKMFLVQFPKDSSQPAKLVIGDLDHVYAFD